MHSNCSQSIYAYADVVRISENGVNAPLYIPGVHCCVNKRGELLCACLVTLLPDQDLHTLPFPINAYYMTTLSFECTLSVAGGDIIWNVHMTSNKVSDAACWRQPVEGTPSDCTEAAMKLALPTL